MGSIVPIWEVYFPWIPAYQGTLRPYLPIYSPSNQVRLEAATGLSEIQNRVEKDWTGSDFAPEKPKVICLRVRPNSLNLFGLLFLA